LKLVSFRIQNYKSLQDVKMENCQALHTIIGRNSIGKTSIFDSLNLIQRIQSGIPETHEIISKGISPYEKKSISVNYKFKIPNSLRSEYFGHYLGIEDEQHNDFLKTALLKFVTLRIEIPVFHEKAPTKEFENTVLLTHMGISGRSDDEINLIYIMDNNQCHIRMIPLGTPQQKRGENIDDYIKSSFRKENVTQANTIQNNVLETRILQDIQQAIRPLESKRESSKKVPTKTIETELSIGLRGESLINLMDTMFTNQTSRYLQIEQYCKSIFPGVESIRPRKLPDNNIRIDIQKINLPYTIDLLHAGSGIDQLLIIIWRIATSDENSIWLLDEPELHLHPGAQKLLYDFLSEETQRRKQILITTHSMVFMYKSKEKEISLMAEKEGFAEIISLQNLISAEQESSKFPPDTIKTHVYRALGYDPAFSIEPQIIVMVEGTTDEKVLKCFAKILDRPIDERVTMFVPVGNKKKVEQFGPVLTYALSGKKPVIVLDNDLELPETIANKIITQENAFRKQIGINYSLLTKDNFCPYRREAYSIEYYLLNASAICESEGIEDNKKIEEIRNRITKELSKSIKEQMKPKDLLSEIWTSSLHKQYDETKTPEKIACKTNRAFLSHYEEIIKIIDEISPKRYA